MVVGTGWMPYATISGRSFRKYTEGYSAYASRGGVVSQDKTLAGVWSPFSAEAGVREPARRQRADARRNVNALIGVNELQVRKLSHMESQKPDLIRGSPPWHGRHERHACPL